VISSIKSDSLTHRASALALLLVVLYILVSWVSSLLEQGREAQERYQNMSLQLQKYQQLTANFDTIKLDQQQLLSMSEEDGRYLTETTRSLALATLQKRLQHTIQSSGASLVSMQSLDAESAAGFSPVKMKLHLRLSHQALATLLYQLESQQPTGFVYQLQVQRAARARRQQQSEDVLLEAHLEYTVYMVAADDA
jgi:hypothetical protein